MNRRNLVVAGAAGLALPTFVARVAFAEPATSTYKTDTLMVGTLSKMMSKIAEGKAKNPRILEFAGFEVAEQTAIAQVLTNEMDPPPAPLSTANKETLSKLEKEGGLSFERAYLHGQIEGHEKLLTIQETHLKDGMKSDTGHIALLAKAVIKMHLAMLNDLEKVVG